MTRTASLKKLARAPIYLMLIGAIGLSALVVWSQAPADSEDGSAKRAVRSPDGVDSSHELARPLGHESLRQPAEANGGEASKAKEGEASFRLEGRVVDKSDRGLNGVALEACGSPLYSYGSARMRTGAQFDSSKIVASGRSLSDGSFSIELPQAGCFTLRLRSSTHVSRIIEYVVVGPDSVRRLEPIRLELSEAFAGRIVSSQGAGIAGATISIAPGPTIPRRAFHHGVGPKWRDLAQPLTESEDDGSFRAAGVKRGSLRLLVAAPGFASRVFVLQEDEWWRRSDLRLELLPGIQIAGRVLLSEPFRHETLEMTLTCLENNPPFLSVEVDQDGRFTFQDCAVNPEIANPVVAVLDRAHNQRQISETIPVEYGQLDLQVPLLEVVTIAFEPADASNGRFVRPDRVVGLHCSDGLPFGGFHMENFRVVGESIHLEVPTPRGAAEVGAIFVAAGYEVAHHYGAPIQEGNRVELGRIPLRPVPTLQVRVIDEESGDPVAGAIVRTILDGGRLEKNSVGYSALRSVKSENRLRSTPSPWEDAVTSVDGRVNKAFPEARSGWLIATANGYASSQPVRLKRGLDRGNVYEIALDRGARVVVSAVDGVGRPIPGLDVQLKRPRRDTLGRAGFSAPYLGLRASRNRTGLDGEVEWGCLAAGDFEITLTDDRNLRPRVFKRKLELNGQPEEFVQFVISGGVSVEGVVRVDGQPARGHTVLVSREGHPNQPRGLGFGADLQDLGPSAMTDEDGRFTVKDVIRGEYVLSVHGAGLDVLPERPLTVWRGMPFVDVDIDLRRLTGIVRTEDSQALGPVGIFVVDETRVESTIRAFEQALAGGPARPEAKGTVELDDSGRFELLLVQDRVPNTLVVADGIHCPVEVSLERLRQNVDDLGTILLKLGGAVEIDTSSLVRGSRGLLTARRTQPDGRVGSRRSLRVTSKRTYFRGLTPGSWTFEFRPDASPDIEERPRTTTIEIRSGDTTVWRVE